MNTAVVWLKKDLRINDHRPLYEASQKYDQVIAVYIYEPEWFDSYEYDRSHLDFINQSLKDLEKELSKFNITLVTFYGSAVEVFKQLYTKIKFLSVYCHQETGIAWTFWRDVQVMEFFKSKSIQFKEYYQFAVIRRLKSRDQWTQLRSQIIERKLVPLPRHLPQKLMFDSIGYPDEAFFQKKHSITSNKKTTQVGGLIESHKVLNSFLNQRSENYLKHISSPWMAEKSGSRLSPYITYGNISLAEINMALKSTRIDLQNNHGWLKNLWAFENRLWWHCHFIQKLESEFEIEFENVNRAFDGLRESEFNESYFEAWKKGQTGYPLIDATMRCLHKTGWINFRMRAMLVSFASYHLWLHWRKPAEFLARHFLDFEPGIHFSQFQMQSGVTGINSIRIYSPIKQALDQEKSGDFIRKYCPELSNIPDEYIHAPDLMPPFLQIEAGLKLGLNYPEPVVNHKLAYDSAKKRIFEWRSQPIVRHFAKQVLEKHASRKNSDFKSKNHFPTQNREVIFGNIKNTKR